MPKQPVKRKLFGSPQPKTKYIKRMPKQRTNYTELKFLDQSLGATQITGSLNLLSIGGNGLNAVAQGDGQSDRDGRKYIIKKVMVRGTCYLQAVDGSNPNGEAIRIILFQDTQTNGALPTPANVLNSVGTGENFFNNLNYSKRFRILADKELVLNYHAGAYDGTSAPAQQFAGETKNFKFFVKCEIPVTCSSTSAGISDITDNSIHMMAVSNGTNGYIYYTSRIRFVG